MSPSSMLTSRGGLCSLPASVPCSVAPEKPVCRPQPPQVRRTFSLDTILSSYLLGQWPRDADGAFTCCTNDKATQVMKRSPNGIRMGEGAGQGRHWATYQSQSLKRFVLGFGCASSPCSFSSSNVYQLGFLCKLT